MCRKTFLMLVGALVVAMSDVSAIAAIVTATMSTSVHAEVKNKTDDDTSIALIDAINASQSHQNSSTNGSMSHAFSATTGLLTSALDLTAEKSLDQKQGNDHVASGSLILDFQIDSDMRFALDGSWGFLGTNPAGGTDTLSFLLSGQNGTITSGATSVSTGTSADTFSQSGILAAGNYRLSFQADLNERHDVQGLSQAGWSINRFQLSSVTAIPEPSCMVFLGLMSIVWVSGSRRRR